MTRITQQDSGIYAGQRVTVTVAQEANGTWIVSEDFGRYQPIRAAGPAGAGRRANIMAQHFLKNGARITVRL